MKRIVFLFVFVLVAKALAAESTPPAPSLAEQTVVVYNDADPDSKELANYYAKKRGIPKEQVLALTCPVTEEISRVEYDDTIAKPLRKVFEKNGWWTLRKDGQSGDKVASTRIRFVALMRGVPLKIKPQFEKYEGDTQSNGPVQVATHNEASVDSDLAVLGVYARQISGPLNNPYFRSTKRISETEFAPLLLVCRLDAPTAPMVKRMIDDSLAAEATGLRGMMYVDARGIKDGGLAEGDKWLLAAADIGRRKGLPVVLDNGEGMFPMSYPMTHTAVYFGWYAEHVAGPFARTDFKFERGAIAAHLHSFSAATLRDPKRNWVGPLVAAGAAATIGNVYEPYLGLTTNFDVVFDRLRSGYTFAESCYMGQRFLSWMPTFIGDPLYRPYAKGELAPDTAPKNEWEAYAAGAREWYEKGPDAGKAMLTQGAKKFSSGMIMEGLGLLQLSGGDGTNAVKSFEQAATIYKNPQDVLRASIHEVFQLKAMNRTPEAIAIARKRLARYNKEPTADVLRIIEAEMTMASPAAPNGAKPQP